MTKEMIDIEYNRARTLSEKDDIKSVEEAIKIFENLEDYKDSNKFLNLSKEKLNKLKLDYDQKREEDYERAIMLMKEKNSAQRLDQAIKLFNSLEDYKDSNELKEKCINQRHKVMVKDRKNLDRFKLLGYLFAGIGVVIIAFIICAVIWNVTS